jgi:hypothetical protein
MGMKWFNAIRRWMRRPRLGRQRFLCDDCAYNHPGSCRMPMRPHAILCEDYVPKGERATRVPPPNLKL